MITREMHSLKQEVIHKLQPLPNDETQIREIEKSLRLLQDEWEDIGPVNNDEWENFKIKLLGGGSVNL